MTKLTLPVGPRDHILGSPEARVTIVEYLDYECPFCASAHEVMSDILDGLGQQLRFVPRHFPLSQIHPHALLAAQAVEAAGTQGRFEAMHSALFQNQDALDLDSLESYAEAFGLDLRRFTDELEEGTHLPKVRDDFRSGVRSGVNGTPTFFVNDLLHDRGWDAPSMLAAIREADRVEQRALR